MKRGPVIHPFLLSLFPILALYAYNIKSVPVSLGELAGPLAAALACAAGLFFVLRIALKNAAKSGLLVSLLVLWFFSFGHIANGVSAWTGGLFRRSLFFAWVIFLGILAVMIVRSRWTFSGLTKVLNVVSVTLVVFNLASVGQTLARRPHPDMDKGVKVTRKAVARPNIYYIIFDAYTRADILQEVYSYDNREFLSALEARGFTIAAKSYANYGFTYHSLASSLNFTYLDRVAKDIRSTSSDQEPLYRMIRENRAMAFLKSQGYRLFCFSPGFKPGDIKAVDRSLGFFEGSTSEFRSVLLATTPLPLFSDLGIGGSSYGAHRAHVLDAFRVLEGSPLQAGPFLFFVHLLSPHPPFVFGPDGEPVEPGYLFSMFDGDRIHGAIEADVRDYIVRYRDQVAFLNKKILQAVDAILSGSPEPPIIILQGDHGSRAYAELDRPEACYLKENLAILNAYHLPGDGRKLVYPEISPINTFRLIFKHYFGADLDLLEDRSSWCTWWRPYMFIPFDETSYTATPESVRAKMRAKTPAVQKR
jgi:hypothetical protein